MEEKQDHLERKLDLIQIIKNILNMILLLLKGERKSTSKIAQRELIKNVKKDSQMPRFSQKSLDKLKQCHPDIQKVFNEVIKHRDCTILEGYRDEETQNEYFRTGKSKLQYPNGKHNKKPSDAIDVIPYPIEWNNEKKNREFAGFVLGVAATLGIKLRWGGDWDGDQDYNDQTFNDLVHFERKL